MVRQWVVSFIVSVLASGAALAKKPSACPVTSDATYRQCLGALSNGDVDVVRFDSDVVCSGSDACAGVVWMRSGRPALIDGNGKQLLRIDASDYALLVVAESQNVVVSNLHLVELVNQPDYSSPTEALTASNPVCPSNELCQPTIYVGASQSVVFQGVSVTNSRGTALQADGTDGLVILNSAFRQSFLSGVGFSAPTSFTPLGNRNARLEGNVFSGIRSNALVISGSSMTIRGNTFVDDHSAAAWWVPEGAATRPQLPSSGGMIFIYNHSHDVLVEKNEIYDGSIHEGLPAARMVYEYGLRTHGIEINYAADLGQPHDLSDIYILENQIHGLTGAALTLPYEYIGDPAVNLVVEDNVMFDDWLDPWTGIPISAAVRSGSPPVGGLVYPFSANCFDAACSVPQPATPAPPEPPRTVDFTWFTDPGCPFGYGLGFFGRYASNTYAVVRDDESRIRNTYAGESGPFARPRRSFRTQPNGNQEITFCLESVEERDALQSPHFLRVHLVEPDTGLNDGGHTLQR
jgi:hypothetical protein